MIRIETNYVDTTRQEGNEVVHEGIRCFCPGLWMCPTCKHFWKDPEKAGNRRERRARAAMLRRVG